MKLSPRDATTYFKKPNAGAAGLLIFGADPMRIATRRQDVIASLIGPEGETEMRLTRIPAADLRKDKALLADAIKATGFFPGPRVAFVEDANEFVTEAIKAALADWQAGDAQIIVTAGQLKATSALRKAFETHQNAYAIGLYDAPPDADEIAALLQTAGLPDISSDARAALNEMARNLDPGDFRKTVEKLGLYMYGSGQSVSVDDITACAPQSSEAALDDLLAVVATGDVGRIASVLARIYAQGTTPVTLCIGAMRHFKALHTASADPGGAAAGVGKLRPPVYGPRRDALVRQAGQWGRDRLERALTLLLDTDLALRSAGQTAPQRALVERALIRLAMMAQRQ